MQMPKTRYRQADIFLLVVTALPMFLIRRGACNVKAGENKALFNHLCTLTSIADSEIPIGSEASDANSDNELIQHINMTLSERSWQGIFKSKPGKDNWQEQMPEKFNENKGWQANWQKWLKAAKDHEADEQQKKLKNIGADKLTAEQKYFLHRRVRILAYAADKMVDELKALKQEEQNDDAKSASALLKTAAYGQPTGKTPTPTDAEMFGPGTDTTVKSCCENTENQIRTTTIAAVQICLCAAGATLKDVCVNPTPDLDQWNDGKTSGPTRWAALAEHCESTASTDKPEELLDTALGALIGSLRKSGSDRYLGAYRATGCQATQATGFCIKLTGDSQADPKVLKKLPWVVNIRKVIAALRRSRKATERAKLLKANLKTLAEQLKVEVDAAKTVIAQPKATKNAPSPVVGVNSEQAEECKQHKPKMVFEEKSCQWKGKNETEGTCKPKYGEGQTDTAAGTGPAKEEGKKCSEKKTEGECKDGCKWDGKICKDSSFLVNTKLELSMAATFTVLVAFYHSNDFSEFTPLVKCLKN